MNGDLTCHSNTWAMVCEGLFINFDYTSFFNVHPNHGTQASSHSTPNRMQPLWAVIKPATLCSAEHHNHWATAVGKKTSWNRITHYAPEAANKFFPKIEPR